MIQTLADTGASYNDRGIVVATIFLHTCYIHVRDEPAVFRCIA